MKGTADRVQGARLTQRYPLEASEGLCCRRREKEKGRWKNSKLSASLKHWQKYLQTNMYEQKTGSLSPEINSRIEISRVFFCLFVFYHVKICGYTQQQQQQIKERTLK